MQLFNKVTMKDKAFIARQLATMIESGLTLDKALKVLYANSEKDFLKKTFKEIIYDLGEGLTFSETLKKHPRVFDKIFINIVISGEAVGKLADVLKKLANQLEQQVSFLSKLQNALYYPIFIIIVMVIIIIVMFIKVIPPLKEVFIEFDAKLPWTTTALITISDFTAKYWFIVFGVLGGLMVLLIYFFKTRQGKLIIDKIFINYTADLGKDIYMARFCRTLSMLILAGTPILEAIDITAKVVNNIIYQRVLERVHKQVERGIPISSQIEKSKDFPVLVSQMISVGEKTGKLGETLNNLADYYEGEADAKIKGLTSLIEPVIIIIIGLGVAFIVFSVIMPIYQIAEIG